MLAIGDGTAAALESDDWEWASALADDEGIALQATASQLAAEHTRGRVERVDLIVISRVSTPAGHGRESGRTPPPGHQAEAR